MTERKQPPFTVIQGGKEHEQLPPIENQGMRLVGSDEHPKTPQEILLQVKALQVRQIRRMREDISVTCGVIPSDEEVGDILSLMQSMIFQPGEAGQIESELIKKYPQFTKYILGIIEAKKQFDKDRGGGEDND